MEDWLKKSWNIKNKHCQRHNRPKGWVLSPNTKVTDFKSHHKLIRIWPQNIKETSAPMSWPKFSLKISNKLHLQNPNKSSASKISFKMYNSFMESTFVHDHAVSWRAYLVTVITWNRYPFQMVGLNVTSNILWPAFLATHFANGWGCLICRSICMFATGNHLKAFLHHWLHLLIQWF